MEEASSPARLKVLLGAMQTMQFCANSSEIAAKGVCLITFKKNLAVYFVRNNDSPVPITNFSHAVSSSLLQRRPIGF